MHAATRVPSGLNRASTTDMPWVAVGFGQGQQDPAGGGVADRDGVVLVGGGELPAVGAVGQPPDVDRGVQGQHLGPGGRVPDRQRR